MAGRILRSSGAVLAGLVAAGAAVLILTAVAVWLFFGGDFQAEPTGPYIAFNLAYTLGTGVLGGWLAARLAGYRPVLHGAALAGAMVVVSLAFGTGGDAPGVPEWYGGAVMTLGALGALIGGLWERRLARRRLGLAE